MGPEIKDLKDLLEAAAFAYREPVREKYEGDEFTYLQGFSDRTIDIAEPLAAILEAVYEGDPRLDEMRHQLVHTIAITRDESSTENDDHRILQDLEILARKEDPLIGNATELHEKLKRLDPGAWPFLPHESTNERISPTSISATLRRYSFKTKSIRQDGVPKYRYVLPHDQLADIVKRYVRSEDDNE